MAFSSVKLIPGATHSSVRRMQLLPNGNVLAISDYGECYILTPDSTGSYANGTWRTVQSIPFTSVASATTVLNDGRIVVHTGEYGTSISLGGRTCIFDPVTETWTTSNVVVGDHKSIGLTDDGRQLGPTKYVPASGDLNAAETHTIAHTTSENPLCLQPDGRFVIFVTNAPSGGGATVEVVRPSYPSEYVTVGSYDGNDTKTSSSKAATLATFADYRSSSAAWTSFGVVPYEVGPAGYMPKIGKTVLVGGQGWILTYDLGTDTVAKPAACPMTPTFTAAGQELAVSLHLGKIMSANNGQTANTIDAANTITFDSSTSAYTNASIVTNLSGATVKQIFIRINSNSQYCVFTYTGVTGNSGAGTITLTGVGIGLGGINTVALATNDEVCWGRPNIIVQDGPGCFLPNGNLMFVGNAEEAAANNNFSQVGLRWLTWDGSSSSATFVGTATVRCAPFICSMFMLPDGTLLTSTGTGGSSAENYTAHIFYTPEGSEATPLSGSQPVVTTFPSVIERGQSVLLVGTTLNGLSEGGLYGDDASPRTNFPVVRFTHNTTGIVTYGRTFGYTYRGIQAGRASSCYVKIPTTLPDGEYTMHVVASGVPSAGTYCKVTSGQKGDNTIMIKTYR